ncbi:MAG: hypothetical protein FJX75_00550 [Armatimonadetes bacterium]|nr:hypothetical protein [Armatimonadota bacterium]
MHAIPRFAVLCLALVGLAAVVTAQAAPSLAGPITFIDTPLEGDVAVRDDLNLKAGDKLQFVVNYQDESNYGLLDIAAPQACFYRTLGGTTKPIGEPGEIALAGAEGAQPFAILRRNSRLLFAYAGQVACRGWDGALANGKAGYVAAEGQVAEPYVQAMEPIRSADAFVRDKDTLHFWTELTGAWQIKSLRDDDQAETMEADKSANAFNYQVVAKDGPAISLAEKDSWWWTDYRVEASARSQGRGAMGLVLLARDESNYLAFRWASVWDTGEHGNRAELLEVVGGEPKVLAEKPGGFVPDQWYKLGAAVCDGRVECTIDGLPVLQAPSTRLAFGSAGLYAEGEDQGFFDDVVIADYETFREDFANMLRWEAAGGDWSLTNGGEARCAGTGCLTSGRLGWTDYRAEVRVTPNKAKVGLQVARQADGRAALFRVDGQKAQLLMVGPAGETPIAERDMKLGGGKPLTLAASVERGFVRTYVDGEPAVEGMVAECPGGAIGLYADGGKDARFGQVLVSFLEPKRPAQVTREFTKVSEHPEMAEWASSRAPWVQPAKMEPGATWWTKGDYYGDVTVAFKVRFVGLRDGNVKVTLGGEPERTEEGIRLVLSATKGTKTLKAQVTQGTTELGRAEVELQSSSCNVRFARQGAHILVSVDDKPLIDQPLAAATGAQG